MIEKGAMEGQRTWHIDLENAMRAYINQHKNEFFPEGGDIPEVEAPPSVNKIESATPDANLSADEIKKNKQREVEQKGLQWALDTFNGAWNVGRESARGAIDILGDVIENSSSTTILIAVVVVLVASNLWTMSNLKSAQKKTAEQKYRLRMMNEGASWMHQQQQPAPPPSQPTHGPIADSEALRLLLENVIARTASTPPPAADAEAVSPAPPQSPADELKSIQQAVLSLEERISNLKKSLGSLEELD